MNQNDEEHSINDDDSEEEREYNDTEFNLKKILWLPSVKLGKQPYRSSTFGRKAPLSRKENDGGDRYEALEGTQSGNRTPPGYQNIEILPVLPMTMVHGLDGMPMDGTAYENESMDQTEHDDHDPYYNGLESYYGAGVGVWEEDSSHPLLGAGSAFGPLFSGTSSYLPHTKGHVFTVAETRYKKLYDDLIRMGQYYWMKRESALRRSRGASGEGSSALVAEGGTSATTPSSLPDPDEKRRFIVTTTHPSEEGVFAEYGLLFQLKDLDEVAAVASYETGGEEEGMMTLDELQDIVESVDAHQRRYGDNEMGEEGEEIMDILLRTHYEATHDVVGRVKIHRFVNPECFDEGPEGEEYLMAEATVLDVVENDHARMLKGRKQKQAMATTAVSETVQGEQPTSTTTTSLTTASAAMEEQGVVSENVAKAVARIKEELRSTVGEAFQQQQVDPEMIKEKLRSALNESPTLSSSESEDTSKISSGGTSRGKKGSGPIPLASKGILVERRSTKSLTPPERRLRESFTKLVALQHDLGEECRFTRVSVQTFGIGPVGCWLSAAAWSQFVEKRLEVSHGEMQSDLQERLVEYLGLDGGKREGGGDHFNTKYSVVEDDDTEGVGETIDFDDLSPELQQEFQLVQVRAITELGPLALERAIQMQRIVQAESYTERLDLLRECVDNERRRLEAKRMLRSLWLGQPDGGERNGDRNGREVGRKYLSSGGGSAMSREEARSTFERLMSATEDAGEKYDPKDEDEEAFQ